MLRAIIPLALLLAGCGINTSPFVGKWEAVINPSEQIPLIFRAAVGSQPLPVIRLNMELRADSTYKMTLPVVGDISGTWETKENGRLALEVTGGAEGQMRGTLKGLELIPSDENRKLTLAAPSGIGVPVTLLFTRADGK